jgi:hypothetical protein
LNAARQAGDVPGLHDRATPAAVARLYGRDLEFWRTDPQNRRPPRLGIPAAPGGCWQVKLSCGRLWTWRPRSQRAPRPRPLGGENGNRPRRYHSKQHRARRCHRRTAARGDPDPDPAAKRKTAPAGKTGAALLLATTNTRTRSVGNHAHRKNRTRDPFIQRFASHVNDRGARPLLGNAPWHTVGR